MTYTPKLTLLVIAVLAVLPTDVLASSADDEYRNGDAHGDKTQFYAGRTKTEYEYVKNKVKLMLEKLAKDVGHEFDETSPGYKDIMDIQHAAIGDILLTADDVNKWFKGLKDRKKRKIYNFENYPEQKWSFPIKYMIDQTRLANKTSQAIIRRAIAAWERETCVTFQEVNEEPDEQYLYFTNYKNSGCLSYVGKANFSKPSAIDKTNWLRQGHHHRQPVYLEDPGCLILGGLPMHEIGHALGLIHEAQRLDRDSYITIRFGNIKYSELHNFLQPEFDQIETKGVPYDLGSIMQYGPADFSYNPETVLTIIPVETEKVTVLGQRVEIGFYDAKVINLAYCSNTKHHTYCENNGYQDPHDKSKCKCPAEWAGKSCQDLAESSPGCSATGGHGRITHQSSSYGQTFSLYSPNYRDTIKWTYEFGDQCFWIVKVPYNYQIVWWMAMTDDNSGTNVFFGLPAINLGCQAWVEIRKPGDTRGERICGYNNDSTPGSMDQHYTHSHELHISFQSFADVIDTQSFNESDINRVKRGFHLKYKLVSAYYSPPTTTTESSYDNYDYDYYPWYNRKTTTNYWSRWRKRTTTRNKYKTWYETRTTPYEFGHWYSKRKTESTTPRTIYNSRFYNRYRYTDVEESSYNRTIGVIVGSVFGWIFFIAVIICVICCCRMRWAQRQRERAGLVRNIEQNIETPRSPLAVSNQGYQCREPVHIPNTNVNPYTIPVPYPADQRFNINQPQRFMRNATPQPAAIHQPLGNVIKPPPYTLLVVRKVADPIRPMGQVMQRNDQAPEHKSCDNSERAAAVTGYPSNPPSYTAACGTRVTDQQNEI